MALALLAVGVLLLYLSTSQVWFSWHLQGNTVGYSSVHYKGSDDNGFGALALGALAAGAALIATKGRARLLVAVLTVAIAAGIGALAVHAIAHRDALLSEAGPLSKVQGVHLPFIRSEQTTVWPYIAVVAAILVLMGALLGAGAAAGGGTLSAKYESPTGPPPAPVGVSPDFADVATWQALDRDEDPTG